MNWGPMNSVAEISASLCTDAEQKYGDRDFGGRERRLYFSARQKGRHSRLAPQELCPPLLQESEKTLYMGLAVWGI